jgi:hypothetical protein
MKNKVYQVKYAAIILALALLHSNGAKAGGDAQSARNTVRLQCLTETGITVNFKAGQKMNCTQLLAMDTCMRAKGIHVGQRDSCKNQ